jgi:nuclear pore complex protein Nup155
MLETYAIERQKSVGPPHWVIETFLALSVPYESLLPTLESMFFNEEPPFTGRNLRFIADDILYVVEKWFEEGIRGVGGALLGGDNNARAISQLLEAAAASLGGESKRGRFRELREHIEKRLR